MFRELQLPKQEKSDNAYKGNWAVKVVKEDPLEKLHFLTTDGDIFCLEWQSMIPNYDHIYFNYECQAHTAACKYYTKHGISYPYMSEYKKSTEPLDDTNINEQQPMQFI